MKAIGTETTPYKDQKCLLPLFPRHHQIPGSFSKILNSRRKFYFFIVLLFFFLSSLYIQSLSLLLGTLLTVDQGRDCAFTSKHKSQPADWWWLPWVRQSNVSFPLYRRELKHWFLDNEFKIENKNRVELLDS